MLTNRATGPRPRRHRWLTRSLLGLLAGATAVAVTAATVPARPAAATTTATHSIDLRAATARALTALAATYRPDAGVWDTITGEAGWWQSAVALDDVLHTEEALGTHVYDRLLLHTYAIDRVRYAGYITEWRSSHYDDAGWWALLWLDARDWIGGHPAMLRSAEIVDDYMAGGQTSACGGGMTWGVHDSSAGWDQKNSVTNELYATISARLYTQTGRPVYLRRALSTWQWMRHVGLIRHGQLVADHLDTRCRPVGIRWSYTQGQAIQAGIALTAATGDPGYRATAASIADAATTSRSLNRHGILHEPCAPHLCGHNGAYFAGPYVTALAAIGGHHTYLARNATSAYRHDRSVDDEYGIDWAGPIDRTSTGRQASAVALLAAATQEGQAR